MHLPISQRLLGLQACATLFCSRHACEFEPAKLKPQALADSLMVWRWMKELYKHAGVSELFHLGAIRRPLPSVHATRPACPYSKVIPNRGKIYVVDPHIVRSL